VGSHGFGWILKGRVIRIDQDLGQYGHDVIVVRNDVAQFLFYHVADHADRFCAEYIQRVGVYSRVLRIHQG